MDEIIHFKDVEEQGPQIRDGIVDVTSEMVGREEVDRLGDVKIHVTVDRGDLEGDYIAEGTVTYTADMRCSRCVEPYPFANTSSFAVTLRPRPAVTDEDEEVEIVEGELDVEFYSEPSVSLRELAVEQIQLTLPMKPICEDNCLGLCGHCGMNLNQGSCSCQPVEVDDRWGALKDIREQLARKKQN